MGFFNISVLQNIETKEGETLWWNPKNFKKKSHSAEKNPSEKHQRGILCVRGSERRCFCFGRGSGVSSKFRTSVVQVDDFEHMNKKVNRTRLIKLPTVIVGLISY